ncbi:hypothetical protein PIB30_009810 [Stylosanthes scabra]|uniref:Uncharacterized protein n=1 Tax=Stylosanthes scabra TaxID=79078 RepID=A0ABU6Z4Z2_9FABA|nr:hypothetical protein [Stylosanthes scabra]
MLWSLPILRKTSLRLLSASILRVAVREVGGIEAIWINRKHPILSWMQESSRLLHLQLKGLRVIPHIRRCIHSGGCECTKGRISEVYGSIVLTVSVRQFDEFGPSYLLLNLDQDGKTMLRGRA